MSRILLVTLATLLAGCIDLSGVWFNPVPLEAYDPLPHLIVPETHVEFVEFPSQAVEDEEEAPVLWGVWLHQCLDQTGTTCADHSEHPEFVEARRNRTILYFHGNGGNLLGYWDRMQILWRMGYRIFVRLSNSVSRITELEIPTPMASSTNPWAEARAASVTSAAGASRVERSIAAVEPRLHP